MKYSNQYGIPEEFCEAIHADPYDKGKADFSVTELVGPPQIKRLWDKHTDEIVVDVRDEMWRLFGQGVHEVLSRFGVGVKEERLFASLDGFDIVSGQIDRRVDDMIVDYKVTKEYGYRMGLRPEWESQVNVYAWLCHKNGIEINSAQIRFILRDWTRSWYKPGGKYPHAPVMSLSVPLWSVEDTEHYLKSRITIHTQPETAPCTDEERWDDPSWRHEMPPAKSSRTGKGRQKNYTDLNEALAAAAEKGGTVVPVDRNPTRCTGNWCGVADFCPQFNSTTNGEDT